MSAIEHKLPDREKVCDAWGPRCPWCRAQIDDLAVPIDALLHAHENDTLTGSGNWLYREREFDGAECACPSCSKPLLVKFVTEMDEYPAWRKTIVIAPMMTATDARFLAEKPGLF